MTASASSPARSADPAARAKSHRTLTLTLTALAALAWGGLALRAQISELQAAKADVQRADEELRQAQQTAARLPAEQQRQQDLQTALASWRGTLPDAEGLAEVLTTLRAQAASAGLTVLGVTRTVTPLTDLRGVRQVTLALTLAGNGPGVQALLDDLATGRRAITAQTFTLTATPEGVNTSLTLSTYARSPEATP